MYIYIAARAKQGLGPSSNHVATILFVGHELVQALNRTDTALLLQGILLDKNGVHSFMIVVDFRGMSACAWVLFIDFSTSVYSCTQAN